MTPSCQHGALRVTLVQRASSLDPAENLAFLDSLTVDGDLVVLPEAAARDFGEPGADLAPYAEPLSGTYPSRLSALAEQHHAAVLAGMFETSQDPTRPFNTLVLAQPGAVSTYRKIHLYDSFGFRESDRVQAGPLTSVVAEVAGWQVGLMTCYDLRFPELGRALVAGGAEVLVVPSAWVAGPLKVDHWRTLVRARAIENTAYVVAVGQPGPRYTGHSLVVAPDGEVLVEAGEEAAELHGVLDRETLVRVRKDNPSLGNRRL
jgi:predicted amidohydrolase